MTNLKTQLPSLNANELKMLARIIADEVIGSPITPYGTDETETNKSWFDGRNHLRKWQLERLATLIGNKE